VPTANSLCVWHHALRSSWDGVRGRLQNYSSRDPILVDV